MKQRISYLELPADHCLPVYFCILVFGRLEEYTEKTFVSYGDLVDLVK